MKRRVRLIEDDAAQLEIRGMLLEAKGYEVVMQGAPADLVLMDLRIPSLQDGLAAIRELKKAAPAPRIIVLSGDLQGLKSSPEAAMVDAMLEKPCPTGLLLRTIEAVLKDADDSEC